MLSEKKKGKWGVANQVYLHLSGNLMCPCILLTPRSFSADCHLPLMVGASIISLKTPLIALHLSSSLFQQRQGKSRAGLVQREGMWSVSCHSGWVPALARGSRGCPCLGTGKVPGQSHSAQVLLQHTGKARGSWKSWTQIPVFLCLDAASSWDFFLGAFVLLHFPALKLDWKCSLAMTLDFCSWMTWTPTKVFDTPHLIHCKGGKKAKKAKTLSE